MIQAVILDMDGLLLDSEPAWYEANIQLLKKRGHEYTKELSKQIIGTGHKEAVQLFKDKFNLPEDLETLAAERKSLMYETLFQDIQLFPGAKQLIYLLAKNKYKLAIATGGHTKEKVKEILNIFSLDTFFPVIVSSDEVAHGKPAPDIFLEAAKRLGIAPTYCLVLEDASIGVIAGNAAGMKVVAVPNIYTQQQNFSKADRIVTSLTEITLPLIKSL